ncbi:LCP family protein [Actinoplanes sp. RD1]|uniref:LCP family protein n=1 Tax=Actinoplanes sp. RD1 TaxID=3064538 RepID=UPI003557EFCE
MATSGKTKSWRRTPLWARLCAVFGCVLMVISGGALVGGQALMARYAGAVETTDLLGGTAAGATTKKVSEIKGPLNLLLVGIDPRSDDQPPLSDSIIIVHVTKSMEDAQLFSIPRDLLVDIPPFEKTGFRGGRSKINAAMSLGSSVGNGKHDVTQGFELLAKTVSQLTGIKEFDAGAIINFNGFKKIVEAMGGVTMTIDQVVKSEHLQPSGKPRPRRPECADNSCEHPYIGPQKTYKKGTYHLEAWEALDYVRQRYGLPNSDYDRQRHQQQFIRAIAEQALSKGVVSNPVKLDSILRAAGDAVIFDGAGHDIVDWALALHTLDPAAMATIKLPGGSVFNGDDYLGEGLADSADDFFEAVQKDTVTTFLLDHPEFLQAT